MSNRIIVAESLSHKLPFKECLSWEEFQLFCTDILKTDKRFVDARDFLKPGNAQAGIDVYAIPFEASKGTVAQCKLEQYISPKGLHEIVDIFLQGSFATNSKEFILCTSFDFKTAKAESAINEIRLKLKAIGIEFILWDKSGLEAELRTNPRPQLIARYFGEEIAFAFYGEIFSEWIKQYRKIKKYPYTVRAEYIERTLSLYGDLKVRQPSVYESQQRTFVVTELYKKAVEESGKRIVLLSNAGFGKTWEAEHLASHYADEKLMLFPIKIYLSDYNGQSIYELLEPYQDWEHTPKKLLLLVFDGFDEVAYNNQSKFTNHLNLFTEANPQVNIFVSSRFNAYDLTYEPLRNFEVFILNEFTAHDIDSYVSKQTLGETEKFYKEVEKRGFKELISSPYYLTRLVRFFNDKNINFPENKSTLFERILFEGYDMDSSKYQTTLSRIQFKAIAEKVAFCMTVMDRKSINQEMLDTIIPDEKERSSFSKFFLFTKSIEGRNEWSFEHKNLQEYLCAAFFERIPFGKLKQLISFRYAPDKLQPHFLNTISFLFANAEGELFNPLFEWLKKSQPELLVRFEQERISPALRFEIMKGILDYYGNRDLSLYSSKNFTVKELIDFIDVNNEVLDYFEKKLFDINTSNWMAYDIVALLSEYQTPYVHRNRLTEIIINALSTHQNFYQFASSGIRTLVGFKFLSKEIAERIFNSGVDLQNFEIRSAVVLYLHNAKLSEEYSDFILASRNIYAEGQKHISTYGPNELFNVIITSFKNPENIKKVLRLAVEDKDFMSEGHSSRKANLNSKDVEKLLLNAQKASSHDKSIIRIVYRVFAKNKDLSFDRKLSRIFKDFFEKTTGLFLIFKKFYKYNSYRYYSDLFLFIDENGCEFLLDEYRSGRIADLQMNQFRNRISYENRDLFLKLHDTLQEEFGDKFTIEDIDVDYAKIQEEYIEKNQQMLLNRDDFFKEADRIFATIGKDSITHEDIWSYEIQGLLKFHSSLVFETVQRKARQVAKTKMDFIGYLYDDEKWEWFKVKKIKEWLQNDNYAKSLNPTLISFAENWCLNNIKTLDYSNAVKEIANGEITCSNQVIFNNELFCFLNLEIEDELLLKMLPSDFSGGFGDKQSRLSHLITQKVRDKELLKKTVLDNIEHGLPSWVLRTHFAICNELYYVECLPKLHDTIFNHHYLSSFEKNKLTDYYLNLGGKVEDFTESLNTLPSKIHYSSWRWYLIYKATEKRLTFAIPILMQVLQAHNQPQENKIEACRLLMKFGHINALQYWKEYVLTNRTMPFGHNQDVIIQHAPDMQIEQTVPLLMEVLQFTYTNSLHETLRFPDSIEDAIYAILHAIALKSNSNLEYVLIKLERVYTKFCGKPFARHIEFHKERISQDFYKQQIPVVSLDEAISKYDDLKEDNNIFIGQVGLQKTKNG